jgi:CheY-like chemotaxis protein
VITSDKTILVISDDSVLRSTRTLVLQSVGYSVKSVGSDDEALELLRVERFDLILVGDNYHVDGQPKAGQRIRDLYMGQKILKIQLGGGPSSSFVVDSQPDHIVAAVARILDR